MTAQSMSILDFRDLMIKHGPAIHPIPFSDEIGLSEVTTRRYLRAMDNAGWVRSERFDRADARYLSTQYRVVYRLTEKGIKATRWFGRVGTR